MKYYHNYAGDSAKLMRAGARFVVMAGFRTFFFNTETAADNFLAARGFF